MANRRNSMQVFGCLTRSVRRAKGGKERGKSGYPGIRNCRKSLLPLGYSCRKEYDVTPNLGLLDYQTAGISAAADLFQDVSSLCSHLYPRSLGTWISPPWQCCCRARAHGHWAAKAAATTAQERRSYPLPVTSTSLMIPEAERTKRYLFPSSLLLVSSSACHWQNLAEREWTWEML